MTAASPSDNSSSMATRLRILVLSFRFPPYNSVGAISVGKTVKYLLALGHDVRVVTARDQQLPATLPLDIDPRAVTATGWMNPMRVAELVAGGRDRVAASGFSAGRKHDRLLHTIGGFYRSLMTPDTEVGWGWPAFRAGRRVVSTWRPDVIYASAPPYTALLAASAVASRTGIPWVAGLRDLWSDYPHRGVRLARLDRALESRVFASAAGAVVTTQEAEDILRARFSLPTATVMNGYDPDDVPERRHDGNPDELRIVHTGVFIHDRRDPTPLFLAMRTLRAEGRSVFADFYGRDSALARKTAAKAGVEDLVTPHGSVTHQDSLQVQRDADLLLLLQWGHPVERHVCPAKLFEYAAARRPVLGIGPADGVVSRLLDTFGIGAVLHRPDDIARELRRLLEAKSRTGQVPDVAWAPPTELSRERQVEKLARFLVEVVARHSSLESGERNGTSDNGSGLP